MDPEKLHLHEIQQELRKRNLRYQGLKAVLLARLQEVLKLEEEKAAAAQTNNFLHFFFFDYLKTVTVAPASPLTIARSSHENGLASSFIVQPQQPIDQHHQPVVNTRIVEEKPQGKLHCLEHQ